MKWFLISLVALLLLGCGVTGTDTNDVPDYSFEWAYNILVDLAHDWQPDAHLSHIVGVGVDEDGFLMEEGWLEGMENFWQLVFTHDEDCRSFFIGYDGNTGWNDGSSQSGPPINYTNNRINRLFDPINQYIADTYGWGNYRFCLGAEGSDPELSDNPYAWFACRDAYSKLFDAYVDTVTYEILLIE